MGKIRDTRKNLKVSEETHLNLKRLACERRETMAVTLRGLVTKELLVMKGGEGRNDNKRQGTGETAGEGAGRGVGEE